MTKLATTAAPDITSRAREPFLQPVILRPKSELRTERYVFMWN
jgi:hypothetical protein